MDAIFILVAVLANVLTAGRLICYRRGCSRYRPGVSLLAYTLIVCSGGQAIDTVVNVAYVTPVGGRFFCGNCRACVAGAGKRGCNCEVRVMIRTLLSKLLGAPEPASFPPAPQMPSGVITFDIAFERLIGHEGGYVNHPTDPGGETNWGITKRTAQEAGYTGSMRELTRDQDKDIYRDAYWGRARCDEYDGAIAFQLFDAAVNHGIGNAIRFLQRAAGVADDGIMGLITMTAIEAMTVTDVLMRFNAARLRFYTNLSTWPSFGRGWSRRTADNLNYGADDA